MKCTNIQNMKKIFCSSSFAARLTCLGLAAFSLMIRPSSGTEKAPFPYVWGTATHVLPETTSEESGYFSLCEGLNHKIYVGAAKYDVDAYLIEFDPVTRSQRIAMDVNNVCSLSATGYAAQAKIHTRNFVAPSGMIYVGSKQGYPHNGDTTVYPGGYVMRYNPKSGQSENLGMPFPEQGVIDVVADESRNLLYVVTCEDQHWMLGQLGNPHAWREIGPKLASYASTLLDAKGQAHTLSTNFDLCTYNPETDKLSVRPIFVGSQRLKPSGAASIPTWNLASDGKTAYLILMNSPELYAIDLSSSGSTVQAVNCGRLTEGVNPDSRCALSIGPDGRVWVLIRTNNDTGFGTGMLHHLIRYTPETHAIEALGVLAVKNPDFYDFSAKKPHSHGYHTLPDGTLTPLHHHMAMMVAHDNTVYVTILYPFTLLQIDAFKTAPTTNGAPITPREI